MARAACSCGDVAHAHLKSAAGIMNRANFPWELDRELQGQLVYRRNHSASGSHGFARALACLDNVCVHCYGYDPSRQTRPHTDNDHDHRNGTGGPLTLARASCAQPAIIDGSVASEDARFVLAFERLQHTTSIQVQWQDRWQRARLCVEGSAGGSSSTEICQWTTGRYAQAHKLKRVVIVETLCSKALQYWVDNEWTIACVNAPDVARLVNCDRWSSAQCISTMRQHGLAHLIAPSAHAKGELDVVCSGPHFGAQSRRASPKGDAFEMPSARRRTAADTPAPHRALQLTDQDEVAFARNLGVVRWIQWTSLMARKNPQSSPSSPAKTDRDRLDPSCASLPLPPPFELQGGDSATLELFETFRDRMHPIHASPSTSRVVNMYEWNWAYGSDLRKQTLDPLFANVGNRLPVPESATKFMELLAWKQAPCYSSIFGLEARVRLPASVDALWRARVPYEAQVTRALTTSWGVAPPLARPSFAACRDRDPRLASAAPISGLVTSTGASADASVAPSTELDALHSAERCRRSECESFSLPLTLVLIEVVLAYLEVGMYVDLPLATSNSPSPSSSSSSSSSSSPCAREAAAPRSADTPIAKRHFSTQFVRQDCGDGGKGSADGGDDDDDDDKLKRVKGSKAHVRSLRPLNFLAYAHGVYWSQAAARILATWLSESLKRHQYDVTQEDSLDSDSVKPVEDATHFVALLAQLERDQDVWRTGYKACVCTQSLCLRTLALDARASLQRLNSLDKPTALRCAAAFVSHRFIK